MSKYIIPIDQLLPEFCALRCSAPTFFGNGDPTVLNPRINFLIETLNNLNIPYEIDSWQQIISGREVWLHNIYLMGSTNKMVMAHHDIMNFNVDNCNDNSASVINAIATKVLNPEVHIAITDGEEIGGQGSRRTAHKINEGYFGEIEYVVNLELTACGGLNFFTEPLPESGLYKRIMELFPDTYTTRVPFHDGMILRYEGIDSLVLNPLPLNEEGKLRFSLLSYCHSPMDRITLANYDDMDIFVRNVVTPLIK